MNETTRTRMAMTAYGIAALFAVRLPAFYFLPQSSDSLIVRELSEYSASCLTYCASLSSRFPVAHDANHGEQHDEQYAQFATRRIMLAGKE